VSKDRIGAMPVFPLRQFCQNASFPIPQAEMIPIPVMTISSIIKKSGQGVKGST
jgi:hypothetical protein